MNVTIRLLTPDAQGAHQGSTFDKICKQFKIPCTGEGLLSYAMKFSARKLSVFTSDCLTLSLRSLIL